MFFKKCDIFIIGDSKTGRHFNRFTEQWDPHPPSPRLADGGSRVSRRCPVGFPLVSRSCPVGVPSVPVARVGVEVCSRRCGFEKVCSGRGGCENVFREGGCDNINSKLNSNVL